MITRFVFALTLGTALLPGLFAAPKPSICGTSRGKWREELVLHDHAARLRKGLALRGAVTGAAAAGRDAGNIAVLEDDGNLVIRRKPFNLDERTISFQPAAGFRSYRYLVSGPGFDRAAAQEGIPLDRPADDGAILIRIPFEFPLFGNFYNEAYADSDGNIQFGSSSSGGDRSLGQLLAGAPRVAPLLTDLDPTSGGSIRVYSDAGRVVISWVDVPEYSDYGFGRVQNFQVRLYADGRIEFAYSGVTLENAIVGIAPGGGEEPVLVDFFADPSGPGGSAIAEVFSDSERVDMVSVARRFFQSHDDSYDYLMVYNNMGVTALDAVAYELPVRTTGQGFGDEPVDVGASYGSRRRLQAVINMGPLSQYPTNPDAHVLARGPTRDTPVSIMAHEAGHLFLAYVSVPDADNPGFLPMLGYQSAHWAFTFNSEASLLEGNRIRDDGEGRTPRFLTVDNVQAYAPLDQYLMGFRAPRDVPPTFVITSPSVGTGYRVPQSGVSINGGRRDITVEDVIAASGPRVPDHTVAQRHFRFGIILLVPAAVQTPQQAIDKVEAYRQRFEAFYHQASSENGWADTAIRKSVTASVAPAAGVVAGASITASLSLEARAESDLVFRLSAGAGGIAVPETVTIPAGNAQVSFDLQGIAAGVADLQIQPADEQFETVYARIQVAESPKALRLEVPSGDGQMVVDGRPLEPVRIRVSDGNRLAYPGLKVVACPQGGSVSPERATTDSNGTVSFEWSPANAGEALKVLLENGEAIEIRSARDGDSEESPSLRGVGRMTTASR